MNRSTYWNDWWKRKASRRVLLGQGLAAGAGLAGIALVGCGDDDDTEEPTPAGNGARPTSAPTQAGGGQASQLPDHPLYKGFPNGKTGGKFVLAQSDDPVGADPHSHEEPGTQSLVQPIYNGLLFPWEAAPGEQEVMGELVEDWEQPNDTELILHLRKGVKFQNIAPVNGREFVSSDVKFNLERMVDDRPENRVRGMFEPITSIELPDDYTVRLKLAHPFAPLLINLAFTWASMVPHEIVESGDVERTPIGTGPYVLDKWERGSFATWKRNPDYWKPGLPFFDEMEMQVIADRAVREAKYLSQELDIGAVNVLGSKEEIIQSQKAEIESKVGGTFIETNAAYLSKVHLYFNVAHKPFDDVRVRQAFSYAFAYDQIIQAFYAGRALRTGEMSSGNTFWAARPEDMPAFDVAKAKALLDQAGAADLKTESWVSIQYSGSTVAPIVQGLLQQTLGIDVAPKVIENAQWISEVYRARADYPISSHGDWSFDDPDRTLREYYHSQGTAQHQNLNDPDLDEMLDKQRTILDREQRRALVQDIQKYLMEQAYTVPLFTGGGITAVPPWLASYPDFRGGNVSAYRVRDLFFADGGPRGA